MKKMLFSLTNPEVAILMIINNLRYEEALKLSQDKFSSLKNDEKEDEIKESSEPSSDEKKSAE